MLMSHALKKIKRIVSQQVRHKFKKITIFDTGTVMKIIHET